MHSNGSAGYLMQLSVKNNLSAHNTVHNDGKWLLQLISVKVNLASPTGGVQVTVPLAP